MWRIGPAFSPSRASRAAVSASSGMPSAPQREQRLADARRAGRSPWSVRTWRSSPECELAMMAISAGCEVEGLDAAGLDQGERAERLDRRAQGDDPVRIAEDADELAVGVGLDDVAAVDALLDPVAELADEDRASRRCGGPPARAVVRRGRLRRGCGHDSDDLRREGRALRNREDTAAAGPGASVRCVVTPRRSIRPRRREVPLVPAPTPPRLARIRRSSTSSAILRDEHDGAEEVPRGRARAVVAARLRGAGRRAASGRARSGRRSSR